MKMVMKEVEKEKYGEFFIREGNAKELEKGREV